MRLITWGKVNLTLFVRGVRADGYHLLHSYVASVNVGDRLEVEPDPSGHIHLEIRRGDGLPQGPDNLAWKAADRLRRWGAASGAAGRGARIRIEKEIPAAAGMGGASANAAGVLYALNKLWGLGLDEEALAHIGLSLGADVPFCLRGGLALMEGIGERLTPLPIPGALFLLLVTPPTPLSTPEVYRRYDERAAGRGRDVGGAGEGKEVRGGGRREPVEPGEFLRAWREGPHRLAASLHNDLEAAAMDLSPAVGAVKEALLGAGALGAVMSGSGPTVIGVVSDEDHGRRVEARIRRPGWEVRLARVQPVAVEECP